MQEIWKDIKGYEGLYQVSNYGRVKSLPKNTKNQFKNGLLLTPILNNKGYYMIGLYKNRKCKHYLISRLVAQTFIANPNNFPMVNHKDENPKNNYVENLEWCDRLYNMNYGTQKQRAHDKTKIKINQYTLDGKYIKTWNSITEANNFYKTSHISECCNSKSKRKSTKGYLWGYVNK